MTLKHAFLPFLMLVLAVPAAAEMVTARDPAAIAAWLTEKGYRAEIVEGTDSTYVRTADSGIPVTIFFMSCEGRTNCSTIQFYTGFTDAKNVPLERINAARISTATWTSSSAPSRSSGSIWRENDQSSSPSVCGRI